MFKGTTARPVQFGRLFRALGSQFNAFTSYDKTVYFGTVQRNKLQALLTLEADRMEGSVINTDHLTSEKRVVISELEGYENSPGYRLNRAVMRSAFPSRQYGLPVGGTKFDVQKFTVEQVQNYYKRYYSPDNATLIVTGDFTTKPVLKAIQESFGKIPRRSKLALVEQSGQNASFSPSPSATSTTPNAKAPIILKEPGSAALLEIVYPLPNLVHPDVPAIDVMNAVLTKGRSSRLYQALVETGLASSVSASSLELIEPGWYKINATAAPGKELTTIADVLLQKLVEIQQKPVTADELNRAKTLLQSSFILGNQDITSQARQLGENQIVAGDYHFAEKYLAGVAGVSADSVQRVAKTYIKPSLQTIGFFEPTQPDGKSGTSSGGLERTSENFNPGKPVDPEELAKYLPSSSSATASTNQVLPEVVILKNGMRVLLLRDRSLPSINISGQIAAGTEFDLPNKAGVANLVASNLKNGTKTQNALTLARTLDDIGAALVFGASSEGLNMYGLGLSPDLPILVKTLADVVQNATFPTDQLELSRQRSLLSLKAQLDDPRSLARRVFQQAVYPENHPLHIFPTEASLKAITREDLATFYKQHYRPDTTTIAFMGDFDPNQVKTLLNQAFGNWQAQGQAPTVNINPVVLPTTTTRFNSVIPGKAEAVTDIGYNGISRKDPRYYAAMVLNQILGGDTLSSRLGTEVRDRQGLTYGIRSQFAAGINPGPFVIQMQTAPGDAQKAITSVVALLKQVRDQGITRVELNNAKRSITSSYPVELAKPGGVVNIILSNAIYGLSTAELREFPKHIDAVTMPQVQQVIQELIQPDKLVIVTAGPGETAQTGKV